MPVRRALVLLAVLALFTASVAAADVTGRWTAVFDTEVGEQQYTFEFAVKGTQLTGTAKGNLLGESQLEDGTVDGDSIAFVENASFEGMALRVTYTGTIVSDDEIRFTRNVGDFATEQLVARRAK